MEKEKRIFVLNRDTFVPIGAAITVLAALASGIYWISSWMSSTVGTVDYTRNSLEEFKTNIEVRMNVVEKEQKDQQQSQIRTEEKLKSIDENVRTLKDSDIKELRDDVKKLLTAPQFREAQ